MAKILVADDNSNVQKTVALALAELGVEVVAVNNGEAAVKKLSDVSPDLVLADIFMPVRNGYEVCEFVKKDSRFAGVPVVLLVGAFDPLDEREAQRVGADGILKKPFVPPDPLITMVKTLLDRTLGDRLVAVAVSKPAVSAQGKAGGVATTEEHPSAPEMQDEHPAEEFHPPAEHLSFGETERPMAFGQLLESLTQNSSAQGSATVDPVDNEQILTSSRDASLGDPIFWRTEEPKPEIEEENSEPVEEASADIPLSAWKPDEEAMSRAKAEFLEPLEPFELVREEKDQETVEAPGVAEPSSLIVQDPASQASLTVDAAKPADLAANPIEWMASVPPPPAEEIPVAAADWGAEGSEASEKSNAGDGPNLEQVLEPVAPESSEAIVSPASIPASIAEPLSSPLLAPPAMKPFSKNAEDTARSILKQDWADLTASLQAKPTEPAAESVKPATPSFTPPPAEPPASAKIAAENSTSLDSKPLAKSADDSARSIPMQEWTDLAASLQSKAIEPVTEKTIPTLASVTETPAAPTASAKIAVENSTWQDSKPLTKSPEDTARSIPTQDWADLSAGLSSKTIEPVPEKTAPAPASAVRPSAMDEPIDRTAPANSAAPDSKPSKQNVEDTAHSIPKQDWANLAASLQAKSSEPVAEKPQPVPEPVAHSSAASAKPEPAQTSSSDSPDPALVEAVVQRVLEKMRPQVVEIITKEFLRPVVQALVHREIQKR